MAKKEAPKDRLEAQNAQLRIQLQRCRSALQTMIDGTDDQIHELIEDAPKLLKQTMIDGDAGIEILAERTMLRLEVEKLRKEIEELRKGTKR